MCESKKLVNVLRVHRMPDYKRSERAGPAILAELLCWIGELPSREGLRETPKRAARAWLDWTDGYAHNAGDVLKSFEDGAQDYDQMVLMRDIPVYSHCEHHLAPFFGVAH